MGFDRQNQHSSAATRSGDERKIQANAASPTNAGLTRDRLGRNALATVRLAGGVALSIARFLLGAVLDPVPLLVADTARVVIAARNAKSARSLRADPSDSRWWSSLALLPLRSSGSPDALEDVIRDPHLVDIVRRRRALQAPRPLRPVHRRGDRACFGESEGVQRGRGRRGGSGSSLARRDREGVEPLRSVRCQSEPDLCAPRATRRERVASPDGG